MDDGLGESNERVNVNQNTNQHAPPAKILSYQVADTALQKPSSLPYLAKLTAFLVVFLSVLFSLSTLISYAINKLIVTHTTTDYSYFSSFDNYLVISAIATLIVALPTSALLLFFVRRSEHSERWRNSQKWRRVVYTIAQVVLIVTVISTLIGTVYTVFSHSLNLDISSSYYGSVSTDSAKDSNVGNKITAAVISGLLAVIVFCLGIITLASEYAAKWRQMAWGVLVLFSLIAATVGVFSVVKVQEQIKKQTKEQTTSQSQYDSYSKDQTNGDSPSLNTPNGSTAKADLEGVRLDLNYYASYNNGKFPTKAQWDDSTWKKKYILIDETTVKKITYSPTGCEATGCTSYTLSIRDDNGSSVELKSDSSATSF